MPLLGSLFKLEIACYIFSYGGLFFDLLVPALLLYERTRLLGFALSAAFHIMNKIIFNIGVRTLHRFVNLMQPFRFFLQRWGHSLHCSCHRAGRTSISFASGIGFDHTPQIFTSSRCKKARRSAPSQCLPYRLLLSSSSASFSSSISSFRFASSSTLATLLGMSMVIGFRGG